MISHLEISMYSACIYSAVLTYTPYMYWTMEHHSHQRWEFLVQNKRNNFSISGILNFMFSLSLSVSPYFDVSVSLVLFQSFGSQSVVMTVSGFSIGNGCQSNTVRCGLFCSDSKLSRLTIADCAIDDTIWSYHYCV